MSFYTYALKSVARNYIYVGLTSNVERRVRQHNEGKERTTRPYHPFQLILSEEFATRTEARTREKFLKSGFGKELLRKMIQEEFIS